MLSDKLQLRVNTVCRWLPSLVPFLIPEFLRIAVIGRFSLGLFTINFYMIDLTVLSDLENFLFSFTTYAFQ